MRPFQHIALALGLTALVACTTSGDAADGDDADGARTSNGPFGLSKEQCEASPAPAVFSNGLCVCGDFNDIGNLIVKAGADGSLGSVGVNGMTKIINNAQIDGAWASGKGFQAIGNVNVKRSMYTPGDMKVTGNVEIGQNLQVGGAMSGFGRLAVGGELGVQGKNSVIGYQKVNARGAYKPTPEAPCGCGGKGFLDVGAAIDRAKAKNDNGAKNVPSSLSGIGFNQLDLETGDYYFGNVSNIGFTRIRVKGAVSMYVDGSLEQIGAEVFDLVDGSTLDLYVRGSVKTIGHFRLGDAKNPAGFRLLIGGGDEISLAIGNQIFHGAIYAPTARLKYIGNTIVEGAVFAKDLSGIGNFEVRAARPKPAAGCPGAPGTTSGGGASSSGGGGTGGGSGTGGGGGTGGGSGTGGGDDAPGDFGGSAPPRSDGVGTPPIR